MRAPAIVQGDKITGVCMNHMMPSGSGTQPAGARSFSATIMKGVEPTVLIRGKPAAVINASGVNTDPAHGGIVDAPYATASNQIGIIVTGSATVLIKGHQAATAVSQAHCCLPSTPGTVGPGVPTVQIG